jgi:hypothetical protein
LEEGALLSNNDIYKVATELNEKSKRLREEFAYKMKLIEQERNRTNELYKSDRVNDNNDPGTYHRLLI